MQEKTFALSRRALLRTAAVGAAATAATATIPSVVMAADGVAADTSKIRNFDMIEAFYREYPKKLAVVRGTLNRPLTLTEKILFTHLYHPESLREFKRGVDYIELRPDRAGTHDIGGPMAIIQFLSSGKERIALPAALVCDHLVQANVGAIPDLKVAEKGNVETYEFLRDVSRRYGFDFWPAGSGICHQVFMENYNFPGCMMLVTDSHTPMACGMGMLAIGVGGADLVDALMGMEWELKMPKIIGVKLTGQLQGWTSAKDVILKLTGMLSTKGATNCVVEFFGEGAAMPISKVAETVKAKGYPQQLQVALIGSCTNSSYEDITRAASIARQALENGVEIKTPLMVVPGSTRIYDTLKRDGVLEVFEKLHATVLATACGPCIGQWKRTIGNLKGDKTPNSIIESFNRNFAGRNDGNPLTNAFLASPEMVMAMAINGDPTPKVILSAAGMCDAGRIRHHLKYNLWRPECTVLFVGYQSPGTLGNALVNGAQEVKLFGEPVQVKARIAQLGGLSGHADKDGLEAWLRAFDEKPKFVFVNHGEDAVAEHWANHLKEEGYEADAPYNGSIWIAAEGRVACAEVGNTRKIIKTKSAETVRTSAAYDRLANMGQRLLEVIRHNQGGANKDLAKFASQIAALCDKWDR